MNEEARNKIKTERGYKSRIIKAEKKTKKSKIEGKAVEKKDGSTGM